MALVPQTYERNLRSPRAYTSTAVVGGGGHRPLSVYFYADASGTELIRVEERIDLGGSQINLWSQTISGSNYSAQWPNYDHYIVYNPWVESTLSGSLLTNTSTASGVDPLL
ncbi:MAG: hypothetical protein ACXADW_10780 [Candidatus Hodarchaeales archaeon]|jgi:hypothetical protein